MQTVTSKYKRRISNTKYLQHSFLPSPYLSLTTFSVQVTTQFAITVRFLVYCFSASKVLSKTYLLEQGLYQDKQCVQRRFSFHHTVFKFNEQSLRNTRQSSLNTMFYKRLPSINYPWHTFHKTFIYSSQINGNLAKQKEYPFKCR